MKLLLALALLATAVAAADQPSAAASREAVQPVEDAVNHGLGRVGGDTPVVLLEPAIGVYLDGYGLVLAAQVNLFQGPGISPFHPQYTADEKKRLRNTKLQRLEDLRQAMKALLAAAAADARAVPAGEKVVLAVSLFYYVFEDRAGLPSQIVMQTTRRAPSAIKVQELF